MDRKRVIRTLKRHEGLVLNVYEDQLGIKTIGVGRNLEDNGITEKEADFLLDNDIDQAEGYLRKSFSFFEYLSEPRQEVLLNLCFNMGITRLLTFKRMLVAFQQGNWHNAAEELLDSKYARQVPTRAKELANVLRFNKWEHE